MSVIGLDIGNENCVISVVRQKGIDVLLNEESNRETPAVVSFGEKQRSLGSAGASSAALNPRSTISQVKKLIGRAFNQPDVQDDLRLLPFETSEGPDGGILIHLQYMGGRQSFTPVQILGMLFSHLKQIAEKSLGISVAECVIGIPSYFTDLQRRYYLDAASIVGLKPLWLMHDCTATALGYGIYKTDFHNANVNRVVFVDIGQSDTQVVVASFQPRYVKILSHSFDSNLGGRDFDEVLFCHFAEQFKEQYNIDVYSNLRASVRLRASCEKLKKVLSANAEAPINIECLMDEKDVKGYIKRDDFERLSSSLLERVTVPCQKALSAAGLSVEEIQSVELVGSGSRIPAVARALSTFFKRELSRTLNASECVARGCALQCAMLSPNFRVREYEVQDSLPFGIGFSLDNGPIRTLTNSVLFPRGHPIPSVKILTLQKSSAFHLEAFYANQNELPPGISPKISMYTVGAFQASRHHDTKLKVKIHLNLHGIVSTESAWLIEAQDDSAVKINDEMLVDEVEAEAGDGSTAARSGTRASDHMKRHEVPVSEIVHGGMTKTDVLKAIQREIELTEQDIKVEQAKDKKNSLESYVYETRNKISSTYQSFATDTEREGISQNLQETEDWLYGDGDDETEYVYNLKMEQLKMLVDPVEHRYRDEEDRAQATRDLMDCIIKCRVAAESVPSANDKDVVLAECNKAEHWLQEKFQQQDSLPKHVDPILSSSDIRRKTDALDAKCNEIVSSKATPTRHDRHSKSDQRHKGEDMEVD
ncbi:hypothetical protein V2J09_020998 [Rumex salicifolius]